MAKFVASMTYTGVELDKFNRVMTKTELRGRMIRMRILYFLFGVGGIGMAIYAPFHGYTGIRLIIPAICFCFGAFFMYRTFFFYHNLASQAKSRGMDAVFSQVSFHFEEDKFVVKNESATGEFEYEEVASVYESEDDFYIFMGKRQGYVLAKDSFTVGKGVNFKAFIEEQCQTVVPFVPLTK